MSCDAMKRPLALGLLIAACSSGPTGLANGPNVVGRWNVEYTLDGTSHMLRFDAEAGGKGSFLLRDPRSSLVEPAEPSAASWTDTGLERATFSGPVEFPVGNVGREPGTLVFKGTFSTIDLMRGDVAFYPPGQDPNDAGAAPSKTGAFKATRAD